MKNDIVLSSPLLAILAFLLVGGCTEGYPAPDSGLVADAGYVDAGPDTCPTLEAECTLPASSVLDIATVGSIDLSDLNPVSGVDYISLAIDGSTVSGSSFGTACSGAADATACATALAAIPDGMGFANACGLPAMCTATLVYTRGDEVGVVRNTADMLALFGEINTATEAALIVFASPSPAGYAYSGLEARAVAPAASGFDVTAGYIQSDCDPIVNRSTLVHVAADGTISATCDHVVSCSLGCV